MKRWENPCRGSVEDRWTRRDCQLTVFNTHFVFRLFEKGSRHVRRLKAYWFDLEEAP